MSETYNPSGEVGSSLKRATSGEAATGTHGDEFMRTNITRIADRIRFLLDTGALQSAAKCFIGDSADGDVTLGLTINQGSADNRILTLKSSDIDHGMTTNAETDTFAAFSKSAAADGGLDIIGLSEATAAISMVGYGVTDNTTKSTAGIGYALIDGGKKSGTAGAAPGADANLLAIRTFSTTRFIFDAEGSAHADVEWTTF